MKQVKGRLVPKLRFKEFVSDGNLENEKIGNLCKITTGKLDANAMVENGQYRFYTCAKDYYFIDKYAFDTEALLISGNGANVGYIHYYKGKFNAYQRTYVLDQFTQDIFFIKYYLERNLSKRIATEKKDGNTPYIVLSSISEMAVMLPKDKKEQQKIADCLLSLDELIDAEDKKLEALQRHKKGLMQELFPAEGQTLPKLRFPEFKNDGDWEEKALSKISIITMGSSPQSEFYNQNQIGLPLLQGNADIKNRRSAPRIFTSKIIKECLIGDILMSVRAPVGNVAKSDHNACIGRGIAAIRSKQPNSQEFIFQWLLFFEPKWARLSQGGTFDAINSDDLKNVYLSTPALTEQQKIADCLSSVDDLITSQEQKIDALKTHKKGLMQQLFPNPDN